MLPAHTLQMLGLELAVDQIAATVLHHVGKIDEGKLRSRWHKREHALAEETAANGHAIEAANKMIFLVPHVDARGIATFMETLVRADHILAEPGTSFIISAVSLTAAADDVIEIPVVGDMVGTVIDQCPHRVANVNLLWEDDKAVHRAKPHDLPPLLEAVPGEDAVGIRQ